MFCTRRGWFWMIDCCVHGDVGVVKKMQLHQTISIEPHASWQGSSGYPKLGYHPNIGHATL
jgi:hypothetical protein